MVRRRILVAVLLAGLFALGWWSGRAGSRGELYANLDTFIEVMHKVDENYVTPVDPAKLVKGAITGMLRTLDPYSQYLDSHDFGQLREVTSGTFSGVGLEVALRDHYPTVISPIEGGPAWQAGVRTGDAIVAVNGVSTADYSLDQVSRVLRGNAGTSVTLTIAREGDGVRHDVPLVRRVITVPSVPYAFVTPDGIGYLRIARFAEDTNDGVRAALDRLRKDGAHSLVLDLRHNPGGLLDQAVDVAQRFVPAGSEIVSTRGRVSAQNRSYTADDAHPETHWPMAVLVDEGSASASEIVAGALQDLDRALVVGRTSFGKGSVQNVFPLRGEDAAIKLTTGLYYTPSGRSIHKQPTAEETSDPFADDEDDSDDSTAVAPPAAKAPEHRPLFHTRAGRAVYGGGGIAPDVAVVVDTLGPVAGDVERRGVMLKLAHHWTEAHAHEPSLPDASTLWPVLEREIADAGLHYAGDTLSRERDELASIARSEIARREGSDALAARTLLERDRDFQAAVAALRRARRPQDVFAAASLAPAGASLSPAARRPAQPATGSQPERRRPGS